MWFAPLAQLAVMAAIAQQPAPEPAAAPKATPEPIATRQTLFTIPFQIEQPAEPSRKPVEVQLFVSSDRGTSWQLYSKTSPSRRQFTFRAAADGEFWFAVRTLDQFGQLWPKQAGGPELRVVVDTAPPKLELHARQGQGGQVIAQWKIDEPNLDPGSLKIQYRTDADGQWQSVAIGRPGDGIADTGPINEVAWVPPADSRQIQIRAEVADKSGNPAVSHAQINLAANLTADTRDWRNSASDGTENIARQVSSPSEFQQTENPRAVVPPVENVPIRNLAAEPSGENRYSDYRHQQTGSVTANVNPSIQNRYVESNDTASAAQPFAQFDGGLSPGQRPQMVNSRLFELDYDIESVGSSGISRVELWATRDGGQNWQMLKLDDDRRSPILAEVAKEGRYGFRVVVTSGAGLGVAPPKSGDLPEVSVGVDLTKPTGRIVSAGLGTGQDMGNMIVTWEADDAMLAARPVTLSSSETPGGPWKTVASGLENSGRYAWRMDAPASGGVYLRIEVFDEAGNVGVFDTIEPVAIDRIRPSVRIRNVRPIGKSARRLPMRYYFR